MTIHCNVTGAERKRLAQMLGEITFTEPVYMKAPTFAYVIGNYHIDKDGTIECSDDVAQEAVLLVIEKLKEQGFTPEIAEDTAPAETPAETPDVAPEAEPEGIPEDEATEADVGAETPDVAAPEAETSDEAEQPESDAPNEDDAQPDEEQDESESSEDSESDEVITGDADNSRLAVSIPRAKLADDALDRLRTIVSNKEELFKRALLTDALPIKVTEDEVSFPWFTLIGIDGEAAAYTQFITALCQMATEQRRVLDKPYDGDNDRFTMRIFMVRLGMKGPEFALARKLMMRRLSGNSGWRYEDSVNKTERSNPNRSAVQHLKKAYPNDTRIKLIPMSEETGADIQIGTHGAVIGVDDNGSVFIRLGNGAAFGISLCTDEPEAEADQPDAAESAEPDTIESINPDTTGDFDPDAPFGLPEDIDSEVPFENEPYEEVSE